MSGVDVSELVKETTKEYPDALYAAAGELCPQSWEDGVVAVHFHVYLLRKNYLVMQLEPSIWWHQKQGHVQRCVVDRRHAQKQINRGAFYCSVRKVGTIENFGTYKAYEDYCVQPAWVQELYIKKKVTACQAKEEFLNCVDRAEHFVRNLDFIENQRREMKEREERLAVAHWIRAQLDPICMPASWFQFLHQWQLPKKFRFHFYVLDGPTGLGKSEAIRSQFKIGALLELNCNGGAKYPNWKLLKRDEHEAILLDEASAKLMVAIKAEVQADNRLCQEGGSGTNCYAYEKWFWRIKFIVASNRWEADVKKLPRLDQKWIRGNSIVERVHKDTFKPR